MRFYDDNVESVFISSAQRDYSEVRNSARRAVESLGMRPLMAETAGASSSSPQSALLELVGTADVFLLLLGLRYSEPTEDEFDEARRLSKEIFVLRQEGDCDADQAEFAKRVAGGWKGGRLWGGFKDATDVGFAVVQALSNRATEVRSAELRPQAQDQARELAASSSSSGHSGASVARSVHVPLVAGVLLDALKLEAPELGERVSALARDHGLIAQSVGIEPKVSREGIALHPAGTYSSQPLVEVRANGSVVCTSDVDGSDQFSSMRVDPSRLDAAIRNAGSFASAIWELIDDREEVQQVAVAVAIPNAQSKVFAASTGSNSLSMGGHGMPQTVLVPEPPVVVRRAEVGDDELARRLVAEVRRVFTDAGAVGR